MLKITTERLFLKELNEQHAPFILELVNEPSWIENIGDKKVRTIEDAKGYINKGPAESYRVNGFGLYLVELKTKKIPVGLCGLIKREELNYPDIGYALKPEFWGVGLASEAGIGVLEHAKQKLGITKVLGITSMSNTASIRVLEKIGLKYERLIDMQGYDEPTRLFTSE